MTLKVRRIVTGHDAEGTAVVVSDDVLPSATLRSGNSNALIWATHQSPAELVDGVDPASEQMDIEPPVNGSIFRIIEVPPGKEAYMHKTPTIDYAICLRGETVMLLDDSEVTMRAGDVMVQRATNHGWANRTNEPCQIAFVLLGADCA
jgi:quercetin dioxygenase-like cupin family protein